MLRVSSIYNVKKSRFCRKSSSSKKRDEISALPDELIIHILSFLTPKEAAITSLLSRTWRNLWTFIPNLNLYVHHSMPKRMRTKAFVRMVNNVLSSHNGQHINKFRISYELDYRSGPYIDKWISFALERKVENFILDLTEDQDIDVDPDFYTFPCFFFSEEKALSSIKYLRLAGCTLHLPPYFNNLKSLVELSLTYMEVTEDEIYMLLSSCLLLERFTVGELPELVNLKVPGPSLVYLKVYGCIGLDNIEIWATNLVTLLYKGDMVNFSLNGLPQLEHLVLDFRSSTFDYVANICNHLAFHAPKLKNFELRTDPLEVNTSLTVFPRLVNLKVLTLSVCGYYNNVVGFWYLLKASPFLHLLKMNFSCRSKSPFKSGGCKNKFSGNGIAFTHEFLKEAHMIGVRSCSDDFEFARYLLKNATALNKLVIDPIFRHPNGWVEKEKKATRKAREKAKMLINEAPATVQLFIL